MPLRSPHQVNTAEAVPPAAGRVMLLATGTPQESRAQLDRLKRMAGFESQDFDPTVSVQ